MNELNKNKSKLTLQIIVLVTGILLVIIAIFFISPNDDLSDTTSTNPLNILNENTQKIDTINDGYTSQESYDSGNEDESKIIFQQSSESTPKDENIRDMLHNKMIKGDQIVDQPDSNK